MTGTKEKADPRTDVNDIPFLQFPLIGNAMTDDFVYRPESDFFKFFLIRVSNKEG